MITLVIGNKTNLDQLNDITLQRFKAIWKNMKCEDKLKLVENSSIRELLSRIGYFARLRVYESESYEELIKAKRERMFGDLSVKGTTHRIDNRIHRYKRKFNGWRMFRDKMREHCNLNTYDTVTFYIGLNGVTFKCAG